MNKHSSQSRDLYSYSNQYRSIGRGWAHRSIGHNRESKNKPPQIHSSTVLTNMLKQFNTENVAKKKKAAEIVNNRL